ncbi:MAG: hypothetical protein ACOY0S_01675 [Patescibacteria group bacterium]
MASALFAFGNYSTVARMRLLKVLLPVLLTLILFFIPFGWLQPGEMDLGSDSSRLYFYDPTNYLKGQSLYGVSSSGLGEENTSYYGIPLFLILAAIKRIIPSSTLLISGFYGVSLSLAFLFIYLTVYRLLSDGYAFSVKTLAATVAGLFYIFSPGSILGWGHNILTFNQVFLNPLMFYLALQFFLSARMIYILAMLLLTIIFAPNFNFTGAPPFFAFYPLSFLFLIFYTRYIKRRPVPLKKIAIGGLLFLLVHAFQLFPVIVHLGTPGSAVSEAIFSKVAKLDRGLRYFTDIAPNIRVSISLLGLPQMTQLKFYAALFAAFPLIVITGFLWQKSKASLLTGIFFLIALYWASANITQLGLAFYKVLFLVPGFSMFRNFFGQWQYTFLFFYALLIGQSLGIILDKWNKRYAVVLPMLLSLFLVFTAWPLINGKIINSIHWTSENIKIPFVMDERYEKILTYFRSLPGNGKVLTLPLTDPGYQIIAGKKEGAYVGPSTIAYLTGRQEFSGYNEFGQLRDTLLGLARSQQGDNFKKLLGMLNIRYIFHNADPLIYEKGFPTFPYQHVKKFLPSDQAAYRRFIKELGLPLKLNIDDTFYVYELDDTYYLPEVYVADQSMYVSQPINDWTVPFAFTPSASRQPAFFEYRDTPQNVNGYFLEAQVKSDLQKIAKNPETPLVLHNAFVRTRPNSLFYPFIMLREAIGLFRSSQNPDALIDRRMFFSAKRILELERWGSEMAVLGSTATVNELKNLFQGKTWLGNPWEVMNSWEWNLARYTTYFEESIAAINGHPSASWQLYQKFLLNEYLLQHKLRIVKLLRSSGRKTKETTYLTQLVDNLFFNLTEKLRFPSLSASPILYNIEIPQNGRGGYKIYVENRLFPPGVPAVSLAIKDETYRPAVTQDIRGWTNFGEVDLRAATKEIPMQLTINLAKNLLDTAIRIPLETISADKNDVSFSLDTTLFRGQKGMFWLLPEWKARDYYLLSFEYRTRGIPFVFKVFDREKKADGSFNFNEIVNDNLVSSKWQTYQAVVRSGDFTSGALLGFVPYPLEESLANLEIKNFTVRQIPFPKIMLKEVASHSDNIREKPPTINVIKVNPTKYKIEVRGATAPYTLVLSEAFSKNWRLVNIGEVSHRTWSKITSTFGSIAQNILNRAINSGELPLVGDTRIFETWGKNEVAEYSHFPVNGYANAWYIEPKDMGGKTDYDLTLEMASQKVFYGSIFVSIIGGVVMLYLFVRLL